MNKDRKIPFVGRSLPRREDRRLLTGRGQFIADLDLPHMLHAVFVRSPLAHARIRAVDLSRAALSPGVAFALSGVDLARLLPPVPDSQLSLPRKWASHVAHKFIRVDHAPPKLGEGSGAASAASAVAAASLMTGVAMVVSVAIMIASFKTTVYTWVDQTVQADLIVSAADPSSGVPTVPPPTSLVDELRTLPGVLEVDALRSRSIPYQDRQVILNIADLDVFGREGRLTRRSVGIETPGESPLVLVGSHVPEVQRHHKHAFHLMSAQAF
jgi:hypothetical protein